MRVRLEINGKNIAIAPGQSINREFESNLLNREPTVSEFSYPFKLALTDDTIRALGYLHVLEIKTLNQQWTGRLVIDEVYIREVTVHLLKVYTEDMLADVTVVGDYGSWGSVVGSKKLEDLQLGGMRTIGSLNGSTEVVNNTSGSIVYAAIYRGCNSHLYMNQLANGTVTDDYVFPMCVDEGLSDIGAIGTYGKSVINAYQADFTPSNENFYVDPIEALLATQFYAPIVNGTSDAKFIQKDRFYWVPMFRLHFVIRKCFEEFGYTLAPGSVLEDQHFKKIILYNTYAINNVTTKEVIVSGTQYECTITHNATKIYPQNHMPDMTIVEFIHEIGKKYNLRFDINFTTRVVDIRRIYNFDLEAGLLDLTSTSSKFSVINNTQNEAKWRNGFSLIHEMDPTDATPFDTEKMDGITTNGWDYVFVSRTALPGGSYEGKKAYVRSENAIYLYSSGEWLFHCHHLGKYNTTANENLHEIRTKALPMTMKQHDFIYLHRGTGTFGKDSEIGWVKKDVMVPSSRYGICGENLLALEDWGEIVNTLFSGMAAQAKGSIYTLTVPKISIFPRVMTWLGRQCVVKDVYDDKYPFASPTIYNVNGTNVGINGSIGFMHMWFIWQELTGGYYLWWERWCKLLLNGVPVDIDTVITDIVLYEKMKWNYIILRRNGLNYLLMKSYESFPFPSVAKLEAFLLKN